ASRERAAERYFDRLYGLPLDCPMPAPSGSHHSWHLFPIRVHETAPATRDDLIEALTAHDIGTSVHYRPLHQMTYWKERYPSKPGDFPVADRYFAGAVTLPLFPGMSDAQVDRVTQVIRRVLK